MTNLSADIGPNVRAYLTLISDAAFVGLSDEVKEQVLEHAPNVGSPVVHFVALAELIYAARATLPAEALRFGAQAAFLCRSNAWHGLGDGRGWAIQQALQRDAGDEAAPGSPWPDPADDPPAQG